MKSAQVQVVYYNAEKMKSKKLEPLLDADIRKSFAAPSMHIFDDAKKLGEFLLQQSWNNKNLLMMSSGNFGGLNVSELADKINS
jgi:UDP-N-acetylmuramate: L-alanyl-gamma-D-glutamyl-meso-diaminopimelate ligase